MNIRFRLLPLLLPASAQLYTGLDVAMTIKSGTLFSTDSLVLTPATYLSLQNIVITPSYTAVQGLQGSGINRVYKLSTPLTVDGTVGLYYTDAELNGHYP